MPVNPERPLAEDTCAEALKRVREAAQGSSLISLGENRLILERAIALAEKLCLGSKSEKDKKN